MHDLPRVLYVAGYSRSGSTLLDMVLGHHPRIQATGELTFLLDDAEDPGRTCTCGAPYLNCPHFGPWLQSPAGQRARHARAALRETDRTGVDPTGAYAYAMQDMFRNLASAGPSDIILDSSKSARDAVERPIALRAAGLDVWVLHLLRDPRAVIQSYRTNGRNWVLEGHKPSRTLDTFRPILGWARANRRARALGQVFGPDRLMTLKFEEFLADPGNTLMRIGTFLDADFTWLASRVMRGDAFAAQHNVGGNRARFAAQTITPRRPPRARLPVLHEAAFRLAAQREARQFGYA